METTTSQPEQEYTPAAADSGILATRLPSTVLFTAGILLFFLPFAEIRCKPVAANNSEEIGIDLSSSMLSFNNSGWGLASGSQWKSGMGAMDRLIYGVDPAAMLNRTGRQKPNTFAIVALIMAITGLGFSIINLKGGDFIAIVAGIFSAGALVGLLFDLKGKIKNPLQGLRQTGSETTDWGFDKAKDISLSVYFTPWFYVAVVTLLTAAFFSYRRMSRL